MVGGKIGNGGQDMRMDESMTQVSSEAEKQLRRKGDDNKKQMNGCYLIWI